jgi:hypothetical protein
VETIYVYCLLALCIGSLFIGWLIEKCPLLAGFIIAIMLAAGFYAGFIYGSKVKQIDYRPPKTMQCAISSGIPPGVLFLRDNC